jgi:undecaprenyl-diphosphatase
MTIIEAILLGIVEGITEFLPISSTGHMIIASSVMGIPSDDFTKVFEIVIQFGAILSVVVLYFKRFFKSLTFYYKLFVAFIPSAILGLLLKDEIDSLLGNVSIVAASLFIGGIILLFVDKWFAKNELLKEHQEPTYKSGFIIGLFQAISMIPGVSRSAATIIGGLTQKLNRKSAAEFSFLLAVPTMFAASALDIYDNRSMLAGADKTPIIVGFIVAFFVALAAIKFFITYLTKHGFKLFGWYRILVGAVI